MPVSSGVDQDDRPAQRVEAPVTMFRVYRTWPGVVREN
ncbi:hypothetical protein SNARM312S_05625 [Streptomyces narbonensis]